MNYLSTIAKFITVTSGICSLLWGAFIAIDMFAIDRAKGVVAPLKVEVNALRQSQDQYYKSIDTNIKQIMERQNIIFNHVVNKK